MSLSKKSLAKSNSNAAILLERIYEKESAQEIENYYLGDFDNTHSWELSQEDAEMLAENREYYQRFEHGVLMNWLRHDLRKSPGACYMAARIVSGAKPDLKELTQDWFAHRNIRRELSKDELKEISATVSDLRGIGIKYGWQSRRFYDLYSQVQNKKRSWGPCYQANHQAVLSLATTPNFNRLPMWVKKILVASPQKLQLERIGNIWRLIDCAKTWKHSPYLPKKIAEKVGKMSVKHRIIAGWAWYKACGECDISVGEFYSCGWENGMFDSRQQLENLFWLEFRRLSNLSLLQLINEKFTGDSASRYSSFCYPFARIVESFLGLPHKFIDERLGVRFPKYGLIKFISEYGDPKAVCQDFFGNAGPKTLALFSTCQTDNWQWAATICERNPDAVQKVLGLKNIIKHQLDAIPFLLSLPLVSRIRLLSATTFKYRGVIQPITDDYIRDTGYLWSNIQTKPELGRVRCWFSVHEQLSAAFVAELPDEALPIPAGWERVDGLCAVDGSWILELPKRVATLKYYGEALKNCVGGYGPAIKSGRSVIFVVREKGLLTHCVEVCGGEFNQFYRTGNSSPNHETKKSVELALQQTKLINRPGFPVRD